MSRLGPGARSVVAILIGVVLVGGRLAPPAQAATPDPSDVVLVFDFSASILQDEANRNRFGAALEGIAARVDATSADLTAGDATVSIVRFASKAVGYPGCVDLKLLKSTVAVARFAECLRAVGAAYRKGLDPRLTKAIGVDTNYVAAMEEANKHLPADSVRPAMILFTDGKHDVAGVPVSQVQPARDRLFGARTPFALLPVGMGLDPTKRDVLASGLASLRITKDMPACVSGATFDWPTVVFETPVDAGNAVAVALQNATCTFTAEATPRPTPTPIPAAVQGIRLAPGDGSVEVAWTPPATTSEPIVDYSVRCRAGEGDWIESKEGVSLETKATVEGLTNGLEYQCEVASVGAAAPGEWTSAGASVSPFGRPAAPAKPTVEAQNSTVLVKVPAVPSGAVSSYHFECSGDNGATWTAGVDSPPDNPSTQVGGLTNGVDYLCRAFAANGAGRSDASPLSDAIKPCGSLLQCNPIMLPILSVLLIVLIGGLLAVVIALWRGRTTGYVVAVVDIVHTANIGHGSKLGIAFEQARDTRQVTGIVAEKGKEADIRIRRLRGGRFEIKDRTGKRIAADGEAVVVSDRTGGRHSLALQAFGTNPASEVASRR